MKYYLKSFYRYHIRGQWHYLKAKKSLSSEQKPIVIYSMGKVGSLSLYHSIRSHSNSPIFHIHSLNQRRIDWEYKTCRAKGWWPDSKNTGALIYNKKIQPNQPTSIITTIREPIERNVSAFFEVFRYYNNMDASNYDNDVSLLQEQFLQLVPHDYPLNWLDDELKMMLEIDVFATNFDTQKKYKEYQRGNFELLLMRVDLPDAKKEKRLKEFLNIPNLKLERHNIGAQKDYAHLYHTFKTSLRLPKNYVEQMLDSKYCRHFYSQEERHSLFKKWTN
ncbi:putative capsular polysaccharide synthesis family protein [Aureispira sp. CCB-QB1]|uniref:putative capsular polysaccharide synthesis family protein n=1 Tax=Aureispira sp. CCB-QB1 TaxID=1313421 RepID=UPI000695C3E8|nr:putative capsular polysaccharide synthesis family protein [Aureispira sp. CCB-QB1]